MGTNQKDEQEINHFGDLEAVDIRTVDRESLVDIGSIVIDTQLPKQERIASFIQQIRNPYCFKCGSIIIKLSFVKGGPTLEEQLRVLLSSAIEHTEDVLP